MAARTYNNKDKPFNIYEHLPADIADALWSVATGVARDYKMDADDLVSYVWVWMGEKAAQCRAAWWYDSKKEFGRLNFSYPAFKRDVGRELVKYCQREKMGTQKREERDQLNYSRPQIERYLPYVWHDQVLAETQPDRPSVSTSNDPAYGGNTVVCVMDIRTAYKDVIEPGSTWDRALFMRYGAGWMVWEIAEHEGLAQSTISERITDAIRAITEALNGTPGFGITKITTEAAWIGYPGARKAMSNAKAIALTSRNGEDMAGLNP